MKKITMKVCALVIAIVIVVSAIPSITAAAATSSYSKSSNSGTRDEVCTSLSGTSASSYYTGTYVFDTLSTKGSTQILSSLRTLLKTTHTTTTSYSDCKNYAEETDCEKNGTKLVTLYTSYTTSYTSAINREHVWPKSLGGFDTSGPGADLHHIRPTESTPNSNRSNLKYGNVSGGKTSTGNASGYNAGQYGSYFEPLDNVKGDVARICLYMYVRYGGESSYTCGSITTVFQSVDVLLEWCELDPVDTWEMGRNEVVQSIQGNRNVFIDYPEYAWLLFNKEVPEDMATPSGKASGGNLGGNVGGGTTDPEPPTDTDTPTGSTGTGTLAAPLTTTDAYNANKGLAEGTSSSSAYYVKGKITKIGEFVSDKSYYKEVYITDGKTEFMIYTLNLSNGISSIAVGDTVTVYGHFKNYYGTLQMSTYNKTEYVNVVKLEGSTQQPDTPNNPDDDTNVPDTPATDPNGTLTAPLTVTQAYNANRTLAEGTSSSSAYYVRGEITQIGEFVSDRSYYKEVYITDGTNEFMIYTLNLTDGMDSIAVGDVITVHGYFKNYYGVIEMATNGDTYVTVVKIGADDPVDDPNESEPEDPKPDESEPDESEPEESEPTDSEPMETDPEESAPSQGETDSDEITTDTEAEAEGEGEGKDEGNSASDSKGGCGSSIAGGAVIISVLCIAALAFKRKKREE